MAANLCTKFSTSKILPLLFLHTHRNLGVNVQYAFICLLIYFYFGLIRATPDDLKCCYVHKNETKAAFVDGPSWTVLEGDGSTVCSGGNGVVGRSSCL